MNKLTVRGMVISSMPIGEYDRRIELITDTLGRISAFARGSRKPSSALAAAGRVFAFGEFDLHEGASAYNVNAVRISNFFEEMAQDVDRTYMGYYFLELARFFTREGLDAKETLKLIYQSFRALIHESFDNKLVRAVYEIKLLDINGICPQTEEIKRIYEPSKSAVYAVDFIKNNPIEKLYTFSLTEEPLTELSDTARRLIERFVDKPLRSAQFLDDIF